MTVRINTNIASLNTLTRLNTTTKSLETSLERLSSGLRINRASDDAAGLAISSALSLDSRVYGQAVRNINDGISLLNIAEGALRELSNITTRQRELASQAANGVLSQNQRQGLYSEANALVEEFNNIVKSVAFNNQKLLDQSLDSFRVQAGYGLDGSILFGLGDEIARTVGTGEFGDFEFQNAASGANAFVLGDFNNDSYLDMITVSSGGGLFFAGNGDGTFETGEALAGLQTVGIVSADLGGNGNLDLISFSGINNYTVTPGNGDGTFGAGTSYSLPPLTSGAIYDVAIGDVDNDGVLDVVSFREVRLGNGNGTLGSSILFAPASIDYFFDVELADLNNDGNLDFIRANSSTNTLETYLGNGDGTFSEGSSLGVANIGRFTVGDFDNDGYEDIAIGSGSNVKLLFGDGAGGFTEGDSYAVTQAITGYNDIHSADLNGNGHLDIVTFTGSTISVFTNNGDGTFADPLTFSTGAGSRGLAVGDFNGDGALDLAQAKVATARVGVYLAESEVVSTSPHLQMMNAAQARQSMDLLDGTLARIGQELGAVGSAQSRLASAVNTLATARENFISAYSRIADVDVAEESALVLKNKILQDAGVSILAQANLSPQLALDLLKFD